MLGVLGGMGPLATVDFLAKLVAATDAETDQQHMPVIVRSVPQIPDRTSAILSGGEDPLPALRYGMRELARSGATVVAIPCNTAHYWADRLSGADLPPILHIVDAVADCLAAALPEGAPVALMCTRGTRAAKVYEKHLDQERWPILSEKEESLETVSRGIALVKAGRLDEASALFNRQVEIERERGAAAVIMACTEIPTALKGDGSFLIDATDALARRCVRWFRETYQGVPVPSVSREFRAAS